MNDTRANSRPAWLTASLVVAVLALAFTLWQWLDTRERLLHTEGELAERLAQMGSMNREAVTAAQDAKQESRELQGKFASLESRLAESQNQQIALSNLYQELARDRDDWVLTEVEQTLVLADQQLKLAGSVRAALAGLEAVEARLSRLEKARFLPIREAVARDIGRLKAMPHADAAILGARIEALASTIDRMKLVTDREPPPPRRSSAAREAIGSFWDELKDLVRIQRLPRDDVPLVAPDQAFFLRENLRLRLLSARIAALAGDAGAYSADLHAAQSWIDRYFSSRDPLSREVSAALKELAAAPLGRTMPGLNESLAAVRAATLPRERR